MYKTILAILAFVYLVYPLGLAAAEATVVTVQPLATLLFHPKQEAPAHVVSLNDSLLSLELPGILIDIAVEVGQLVQKEMPLLRLDPWIYKNQLQQAQAGLEESQTRLQLAQRQHERATQLHKNGQLTTEQFDQRVAELHSLTAQVRQQRVLLQAAQERLDHTILKAPFAGLVTDRTSQLGGYAAPGTPLLRLTDIEQVELTAQIRPDQGAQFDAAWQGQFYLEGQSYPVQLRALLATQDPQARTREARLRFVGAPKPFPGITGRLVWISPRPHLPAWILSRRGGVLGVFLARGSVAHFLPLPQAVEGQPIPLDPLPEGAVILSAREPLQDGSAIRLEPER
ncbi:MAG: efflux RND transporter periplasmic adaptor subunit [Magnetococcales bacterium]|nr:efflux RND transporter periplasmic adaptor subunit [Magnetococcales bacterium]